MTCKTPAIGLAVEDVSWGPSDHPPIISNVSFAVEPGERIAIIGPNGAGKSILLRCLYRVNRPVTGRVLLDGEDIWSVPAREVARKLAAVLQEAPADFPYTVMEIVRTGRIPHQGGLARDSKIDSAKALHALEHLRLTTFRDRPFASLSGGEKQRVLLARALAQDPAVIVLDEPTNHLDVRHQLELLRILRGLNITVVTTLHDINLAAEFADRVALMKNGRLLAYGTPNKVLNNKVLTQTFNVIANRYTVSPGRGPSFFFTLSRQTQKETTL